MHCPVVVLFLLAPCGIIYGDLDSVLKHYDLVHPSGARRRLVKRGANNPDGAFYNRIEELQFSAFNRDFRLFLTPKRGIFASKFEPIVVTDGNRVVDYVGVNPDDFMEGHVFGEKQSTVRANVDENGAIDALILLADEAYTVEPAWRYLAHLPLNVSIMYRHSDVVLQGDRNAKRPRCPASTLTGPLEMPNQDSTYWWNSFEPPDFALPASNRSKRQADGQMPEAVRSRDGSGSQSRDKNRCSLKLVADYKFFKHIGREKPSLTSIYLISLIDRINTIYMNTVWQDSQQESGITNMGFVIEKILIHSSPTNELEHYNSDTTEWPSVERLLQKFSEVEGSRDYCLVHLFTFQSFLNGVLGLGYIASAKEGTPGGICGAAIPDKGRHIYYNTALSSAKSSSGGPVVRREADIVTAHEFGHNWGSPHDSASAECSPTSKEGGSFIMYTYSVSGYDANNWKFSPCSKRTIKAVLDAKSHLCFQEEAESFCGNQRVEKGEDCDDGLLGDADVGRCCTWDCKFKPNAICSPKNSPCCTPGCQFDTARTPCRYGDQNRCLKTGHCDGKSAECPPSDRVEDGVLCLDQGECQNGTCVSFCEKKLIGMKPCICENITDTCFRCCRNITSNECKLFVHPNFTHGRRSEVSNGSRCIRGYCYNGQCIQEAADFVQHLWRIIDKLDINSFWKFLYDNIVGTIIIATLIIWIPAGCAVHRWDERARRERQENLDFIVGDILVRDSNRVTVIEGVKSLGGRGRNPSAAAV